MKKTSKPTKAATEKLAKELRQYLIDRGMWQDARIYFGGKAFSTDDNNGNRYYNDPEHLVVLEDEDPRRYTEYAGDILTMTFEGPLYEALNYGDYGGLSWKTEEDLTAIFRKYGLYYEMGHSWDLSAFPI